MKGVFWDLEFNDPFMREGKQEHGDNCPQESEKKKRLVGLG